MLTKSTKSTGYLYKNVKNPKEEQEQKALAQYLRLNRIPFYHIPNGGYRTKTEAIRLKAQGVQSGVPDICIVVANKGYHGLYIELKRIRGGITSDNQQAWIKLLTQQGYLAVVALGANEAISVVERYLH